MRLIVLCLIFLAVLVAFYGFIKMFSVAVAWFDSDSLLEKIISRVCLVLFLVVVIAVKFRTGK